MEKTLTERDRQVIWHPYTQHKNNLPPIPVTHGKGSLLFDDKGNSYIDAISSWWVNIHGHGHPYIAEKVYEQAKKLEHVIFTGFTHEPAVQLAERLLRILPGDFSKIFYSDNGSTAVEVAIKMAIQYWRNQKSEPTVNENTKISDASQEMTPLPRTKILAFHNSYHGDTFGAMSVSERSVYTAAFTDYLFEVIFIDTPTPENIGNLQSLIGQHGGEIACFIYEPLLQAAGGMRLYEAEMMDQLLKTLQAHSIICIADEVLTGFGRTGKLFACEYLSHKADIICLSKGLTGGTMALGVTAATERIFQAFYHDDKRKTFLHGHSFTANPLACTASLASLDLLQKDACLPRIQAIASRHRQFAEQIKQYPIVKNPRTIGTIIAFEIETGKDGYINPISAIITAEAFQHGIYLRPMGNTVYIMPPYCITEEEMDQVYSFLVHWVENFVSAPTTSQG